MPSALVTTLMKTPICRGLSEKEAAEICEISVEAAVKKGQTLFKEGDVGDSLYVLLEGQVEVLKAGQHNKQLTLASLGGGSVLGEMSLVVEQGVRSASAVALTDTRLLKVPILGFRRLLAQERLSAYKIVHNLSQVLTRRLQAMDEKVVATLHQSERREELADFHRILNNWSF